MEPPPKEYPPPTKLPASPLRREQDKWEGGHGRQISYGHLANQIGSGEVGTPRMSHNHKFKASIAGNPLWPLWL